MSLTVADKNILRRGGLNPDEFALDVHYASPSMASRVTTAVLYPLRGMTAKQARDSRAESYTGYSQCRQGDNFEKKMGRTKALGRAVAAFKHANS